MTAAQLLDWVRNAPNGTRLPVEVVQQVLEDVICPPEPEPETESSLTWRERLWTCPSETRLMVEEVAEALGDRSQDTIYRLTKREQDPLPCRKLAGRLVFVAQEVRDWVEAAEYVTVPSRALSLRAVP
jgi:predicted DNA-binding transcriptional regulator AlpA